MQNLNTEQDALLCLEFNSLPSAYRAMFELSLNEHCELLDIKPGAAGLNLVLAKVPANEVKSVFNKIQKTFESIVPNVLIDSLIIEKPHPQLLPAIYSLQDSKADEAIIVAEAETTSGLLSITQLALQGHHLNVIDLRIPIATGARPHVFLTGPVNNAGLARQEISTVLKAALRNGSAELLEKPNEKFREYFNLDGHA